MLTTSTVQHVRHSCSSAEYMAYISGDKTFDIKLNDENFILRTGDIITVEEVNPETKEPTGKRFTRKIGATLNTKDIQNITSDEVANRGLLICSLVQPEHGSLYALYSKYYTMSLVLDRTEDTQEVTGKNWAVYGNISYVPAGVCPEFDQMGLLDTFDFEKWPEGRFYVTVLLEIKQNQNEKSEIPFEVDIQDLIIMSIMQVGEEQNKVVEHVELSPEGLLAGITINVHTDRKVTLVSAEEAHRATILPMTQEQLGDVDNMISEAEMQRLIEEAIERGEPNADLLLTGGKPVGKENDTEKEWYSTD